MIKKAVIPCAGMGTRFLPVTKSVAKEMIPIIDKPSIQYIVEECFQSGIEEIVFVISKRKENIKEYFKKDIEYESLLSDDKKQALNSLNELIDKMKFHFVYQDVANGSGEAVKLAQPYIKDDFFALLYGDDIMLGEKPALKELIEMHEKTKRNIIGVLEVEKENFSKYGMIKPGANNKVEAIVEKPKIEESPSNLAGLGRYIVSKEIFSLVDEVPLRNGEKYVTDAMNILVNEDKFCYQKMNSVYYDIGSKKGYIKAQVDFAKKRNDL